jgi:hypothetical protein
MTEPNIHQMDDLQIVNHKYANRAKGYNLAAKLKQNPNDQDLQQAVHDNAVHQQKVEDHIAFRMARANPNSPSTGL